MLLAVGESAAQTYALAAAEADMRRLVEMQGALPGVEANGGFLGLAGGEQAGGRESLRLAAGFLGRAVGFAGFVPHSDYNNVPLGRALLLRL